MASVQAAEASRPKVQREAVQKEAEKAVPIVAVLASALVELSETDLERLQEATH